VLRISKRPEPVNIVHCPSCIWHEPFCYSRRHRPTPKNTLRGIPGCAVGPKTPTTRAAKTAQQVKSTSAAHIKSEIKLHSPVLLATRADFDDLHEAHMPCYALVCSRMLVPLDDAPSLDIPPAVVNLLLSYADVFSYGLTIGSSSALWH
jgi:hypothetical protein